MLFAPNGPECVGQLFCIRRTSTRQSSPTEFRGTPMRSRTFVDVSLASSRSPPRTTSERAARPPKLRRILSSPTEAISRLQPTVMHMVMTVQAVTHGNGRATCSRAARRRCDRSRSARSRPVIGRWVIRSARLNGKQAPTAVPCSSRADSRTEPRPLAVCAAYRLERKARITS
jgi:hypothetical protein